MTPALDTTAALEALLIQLKRRAQRPARPYSPRWG
jgi:hypothetical protein